MDNFDLISIGDASLDVFIAPTEHEELCTLDREKCLVCFNYADKIPVRDLTFSMGGNAANNAVGSARLGVKVALLATLGDDKTAGQIMDNARTEGVDTTFVTKQAGVMSNYSTAIMYNGERTIFVYHAPYNYQFPTLLPAAPWAYLTSMGEGFAPFYQGLIDWARAHDTKIVFNPGSFQMKAGIDALRNLFPLIEILFVNKEEAARLMGDHNSVSEKQLLAGMVQLGAKKAVITDGANGAFSFDGQKYCRSQVLPVDAYERTGAGDAFASGTLAALIQGKSMDEALLWGTVNSASVIGHVGPQRGLLKKEQLSEWLERAQSSGVKVEEF
ncbi:MAG: carbohydrate kinase family protein [Candidatus Colwellbacteria bacterium]|nr:carbohydrate kinase family protein [Candidatus Colwellbacteria bacterium]MBI4059167.1 carbohydrate kinase family protein [Candidatus Microgenomates bacterium]